MSTTETQKHRPLTLGLVHSLTEREKPIILEFAELKPSTFEIPDVVKAGEQILHVRSEGFMGVVPTSLFSIQKQKPNQGTVGRTRMGYVHSEYELQNPDGSKLPLVIFTTKDYERELKSGALETITTSESIPAEVMSFTEYGAILRYEGLLMELNNTSFSGKSVPVSTVLSVGDVIDVRFKKFRSNGRKIIVEPVIPFPHPSYLNELDRSTINRGDVFLAEVKNIGPMSIRVSIGREVKGNQNSPMSVMCRHPHPAVSQYLSKDIPVQVRINKVTDRRIDGIIVEINRDFVDDAIFEYRQRIAESQAQTESEGRE